MSVEAFATLVTVTKTVAIDLTGATTTAEVHAILKRAFGFPDFYGANYAALVDCWSSLRYPSDGMSEVVLDSLEDRLELRVKGLASRSEDVIRLLLSAIEAVNERAEVSGPAEAIVLTLR